MIIYRSRIKELTDYTMHGRSQLGNQLTGLGDLRLRKADSRDEIFLQQLFRFNRPHLAQIPMPIEFVDALVQQQYELQRGSYNSQFPGYINFLILLHQTPVGNLKLYGDEQAGCLHLLDIGLLPQERGCGHGRALLRALQNYASQKDWILRLSVDRANWRAKKLYGALDFRSERISTAHEEMVWTSAVYAAD